jgi:hypothetical protein
MARLPLSLACWHYDRTHALADGSVRPEGIDLNYLDMHVEETFFRMLRNREFDVAEMSLSSYAVSIARDSPPFVAIPVFPSRFFRNRAFRVRKARYASPRLDRQAHRHARIPDDGAGVDPRHSAGRIRRRSGERRILYRRREEPGRAGSSSSICRQNSG